MKKLVKVAAIIAAYFIAMVAFPLVVIYSIFYGVKGFLAGFNEGLNDLLCGVENEKK